MSSKDSQPHTRLVDSPYLVPVDGSFKLDSITTTPPEDCPKKSKLTEKLEAVVDDLSDLQRMLAAQDRYAVLLLFQAMDAAGKDSTIRAVMSGVNPAGCQVFSFKKPSYEELDHDFLWRSARRLPERGRIGIFNRSYYEEVLVVRVHPEYLPSQRIPDLPATDQIWQERFESIVNHERHLAANGTVIIKFFLNVSQQEQAKRFLSRLETPNKRWKFNRADLDERELWNDYMAAYQEALAATSKPWAPWYAIPADNKRYMRLTVASLIVDTLRTLNLHYPEVSEETLKNFEEYKKQLQNEIK